MISIRELTVAFGVVRPLDALDVQIESTSHAIIGPNGAGKTTLLNALSGLITPIGGSVTMFGDDIGTLRPRQRAQWGLRRTFQTAQLAEHLTIEQNVAIGSDHCGDRSGGRSIADTCAALGLDGTQRSVDTLSTFERRLTEIARALTGACRVLLMDEPAAGVTGDERTALQETIAAIPQQWGATTVIIDHDIELISATCDTATAIDFGRHVATGTTDEVLNDPDVLATYLGQTPATTDGVGA